jgi:predicted RNA-binding protein with PIN domain
MIHYVLDGYNIIKSGPDRLIAKGTLQSQRDFLLDLLSEFLNNSKGGKSITVVFDGPESAPMLSSRVSASFYHGINVLFSEGKTADERIEELVLNSPKPIEIIVVTNDKGIRRLLGGTGARFMGVDEFARKLFPENKREQIVDNGGLDAPATEKIDKELNDLWLKHNK